MMTGEPVARLLLRVETGAGLAATTYVSVCGHFGHFDPGLGGFGGGVRVPGGARLGEMSGGFGLILAISSPSVR